MVGIGDEDLPATFTTAEAERHGVTRRSLQRMLDIGSAERVGRGLYRRTDREPVDYDLIEIAVKAHRPTLCLISALAWHELTDIIPSAHDVAVPRGVWQPSYPRLCAGTSSTSLPSTLVETRYPSMRRILSACMTHLAAS